MSFTNSQLAQKISDLIGYWTTFLVEHKDWLGGEVGGGPGLDGKYPLTDWNGQTSLIDAPAQLADNVNSLVTGAQGYATAASASADAAAASASTATTQAGLSDTARIAAETARTQAQTAETGAVDAKVTAIAQANLATDRAGYAQEWANLGYQVPVSVAAGGDGSTTFSAKHWAQIAENFSGSIDSNLYAKLADNEIITGAWEVRTPVNSGAATFDLVEQNSFENALGYGFRFEYDAVTNLFNLKSSNAGTINTRMSINRDTGVVSVPASMSVGGVALNATLIGQWNTAYGWGNHATPGYAIKSAAATISGAWTFENSAFRILGNAASAWGLLTRASAAHDVGFQFRNESYVTRFAQYLTTGNNLQFAWYSAAGVYQGAGLQISGTTGDVTVFKDLRTTNGYVYGGDGVNTSWHGYSGFYCDRSASYLQNNATNGGWYIQADGGVHIRDRSGVLHWNVNVSGNSMSSYVSTYVAAGNFFQITDANETNYARFSHDTVDFNTTFVGTTDWNITNLTSIQAGTVDADFDAITATSYGGILEANLVDKTATETVSGAWTHTGEHKVQGADAIFQATGANYEISNGIPVTKMYGNEMWMVDKFGTFTTSGNITNPTGCVRMGDTYAYFSDGLPASFEMLTTIASTTSVASRRVCVFMHGGFSGNLKIEVKKADDTWATAHDASVSLTGSTWYLYDIYSVAPYPAAWSLKGLRFTFSGYSGTVYVGQLGIVNTRTQNSFPYIGREGGTAYAPITVLDKIVPTYLEASTVGPNSTPSADDVYVGGYGLLGNRGSVYISNAGGDIRLNHNGLHAVNTKLATTSTGVDITGNITVTGTVDGVDIAAGAANWDTAYGWGDHAGLYEPIDTEIAREDTRVDLQYDLRLRGSDSTPNLGIVRMHVDASNILYVDAGNDGLNVVTIQQNGQLNVSGGNSSQWNTAYGWGNHASAGYAPLLNPNFTDGIAMGSQVAATNIDLSKHLDLYGGTYGINVTASTMNFVRSGVREMWLTSGLLTVAGAITATGAVTGSNLNVANWDTAYGWGNHASAGYAASSHNHTGVYQPLDADLTAIAALAGTSGFLKKTAADTWSLDTTSYAPLASPALTGTATAENLTVTGGLSVGTSDATIARVGAGKLEIEGKPILVNASTSYNSAEVTFSTSAASGGASGDIWFQYT